VLDHCGRAAVFAEEVDYRELMRWALSAVQALADGFLTAGFFNGAGMAAYVAIQRSCSGVLLFSGPG
jgi:hypothetical protein